VEGDHANSAAVIKDTYAYDEFYEVLRRHIVPVAFSEARFHVKKSARFWRHGRYQE